MISILDFTVAVTVELRGAVRLCFNGSARATAVRAQGRAEHRGRARERQPDEEPALIEERLRSLLLRKHETAGTEGM